MGRLYLYTHYHLSRLHNILRYKVLIRTRCVVTTHVNSCLLDIYSLKKYTLIIIIYSLLLTSHPIFVYCKIGIKFPSFHIIFKRNVFNLKMVLKLIFRNIVQNSLAWKKIKLRIRLYPYY